MASPLEPRPRSSSAASEGTAGRPIALGATRDEWLPLSFAQQRMWFLAQMDDVRHAYQSSLGWRLVGELDAATLRRALDRIVVRHEALRSVFGVRDGEPVQRVLSREASRFVLVEHDLRGDEATEQTLNALTVEEARSLLDLSAGPLIRGRLIRLRDHEHALLVTMHHIVSDGWSKSMFVKELSTLYAAFRAAEDDPLPALPIQYADYTVWQRAGIGEATLQRQSEYWKSALADLPPALDVPTDYRRRPDVDRMGARANVVLDERLTADLQALGKQEGLTLFTIVLAGWAALLARLSGQRDLIVGTPVANRDGAETRRMIGCFINTLALRIDLSGAPTVTELLARVKTTALAAQQHRDIPFERVVQIVQPVRNPGQSPLFQVALAWQNFPDETLELPDVQVSALAGPAEIVAQVDLTLSLRRVGKRIVGSLEYVRALFEPATIDRDIDYLRTLLHAMATDPTQTVDRLPLLTDAERHRVVYTWNATETAWPSDVGVHEVFAARVRETPDAVAVIDEGREVSYAELNGLANRLAHEIRALGVKPGERVATALDRSLALVVAELAILKCGASYVPLDLSLPEERQRFLIADCGARVVVSVADVVLLAYLDAQRIDIDAMPYEWQTAADLCVRVTGDAIAYVMYTSGSTGQPKGVLVPHRAITRLVLDNGFARFESSDRVAFAANPAFDATTFEVWAPLLMGGCIVVIRPEVLLTPVRFGEALTRHGVTVLWLTVGLFNQYAEALGSAIARLRYLIVGGDKLDPRVIARTLRDNPPRHLLNGYGPTETTTFAATYEVPFVREDAISIPIGRPIANTQMYILDAAGEPAPIGVAGELYIGGAGVAHGYLNRSALTAAAFVPDPFSATPNARMYRTGDVGRWRADGTIEFLGRTDFQVKIRGFRVEPGEIEARLGAHSGVRDAVVVARTDVGGDMRLAAYFTAASAADPIDADVLRSYLAATLPHYMVPAAYVRLEALPLTASGKVDRHALPAADEEAYARHDAEPPQGAIETTLAQIWAELLERDRIGRHDDFFALGGHSLLAVRVATRVREAFQVDVAIGDLFDYPVLADLADAVARAERIALPQMTRADRRRPIPLSFAQQRLWFLAQIEGLGEAYHISFARRLVGALDRAALRRALDRIVARHEVLRTVFGVRDGEPFQRILPPEESRFALVEHDLRGEDDPARTLDLLVADAARTPFDLEIGPLVRGRLIQLAPPTAVEDDEHVLLITMHHIVFDAWSMGIFINGLSALYAAFRAGKSDPLPELPIQYADYAAWQRAEMDEAALQIQSAYWKASLADLPATLEVPADHPRLPDIDRVAARARVALDDRLTASLQVFSETLDATLFMTLLAAWAALLARLSGERDVVVGTPAANRERQQIEQLIGFFVNTLALRIDLSGAPTFGALLARVKTQVVAAQQHQAIPFEQVVEIVQPVRQVGQTPLFQVAFAWQNFRDETLELPGVQVSALAGPTAVVAKFDLTLSLRKAGTQIEGTLEYVRTLFEPSTIDRYIEYFGTLLRAMVADATQVVDRVPLLSDAERRRVLYEWNTTETAWPSDIGVHEVFAARVRETPDAVAVIDEAREVSYAALNGYANRLAQRLQAADVTPGARVVTVLDRSLALVVAELAILKCGATYVPLDPVLPEERLRSLIADSGAAVVVSIAEVMLPASLDVRRIDVDETLEAPTTLPDEVNVRVSGAATAYVMYTSGSTGQPKGVLAPHRAITRVVLDNGYLPFTPSDRVAFAANPAFDATTMEVWGALLTGGCVVVIRQEVLLAPARFDEALRRHRVTVMFLTVGLFSQYADALGGAIARLRYLLVGGDRLEPRVIGETLRNNPPQHLLAVYGPTETTTYATAWAVRHVPDGTRSIPIGRPIANTQIYILDEAREPTPIGVAGELYIGGAGVADGYLNRPALTATTFVPDPFAAAPNARMYRTGDVGRWRADGAIEFVGRTDFQVKIRGFRVEPGEIEAQLGAHAGVRDAVVLARANAEGDKQLVAYYTAASVPPLEAGHLRAYLSALLPEYMVPAAYVRLDALPLTATGKVDRRALPAPDEKAYARRDEEPPQGAIETTLAQIWAEVLECDRIGRDDDFFALGGHSLLAVRVRTRVQQALQVDLAIRDLFTNPVLADLAGVVARAGRVALPPLARADRQQPLPLSFAQQRLWFLAHMDGAGGAYHMPFGLRLRGLLDRIALRRALDRIVARHEVLRTTFAFLDDQSVQRIGSRDESRFVLLEHDVRGEEDPARMLDVLIAEEAGAPFDLENGPLIRGRVVRLAPSVGVEYDEHALLITMHHIVSDGWSMDIFMNELGALYGAFHEGGDNDPLPELEIQYADYAAWQREWIEGDVLGHQADYWARALKDAPTVLELPTDRPRPEQQDFAGAFIQLVLDEMLTADIKTLGHTHGTTVFQTLLAAWATLLAQLSGQREVVVGTPVANRGRPEIEHLIGFFINTLALRIDLSDEPTAAELLARVKTQTVAAQQHQDIPFEHVVEIVRPARSLAHGPLVQVMFAWQSTPEASPELRGLQVTPLAETRVISKFDLTLSLRDMGDRIVGGMTYATSLFDAATIDRYIERLRALLQAMVRDTGKSVNSLALFDEAERQLTRDAAVALGLRATSVEGMLPLTTTQRDRLRDALTNSASPTGSLVVSATLGPPVDAAAWEAAVRATLARDEIARIRFCRIDDDVLQVVTDRSAISFSCVELIAGGDERLMLDAVIAEQCKVTGDLQRGPLLRNVLVHGEATGYVAIVAAPPPLLDVSSAKLLLERISEAYLTGQPVTGRHQVSDCIRRRPQVDTHAARLFWSDRLRHVAPLPRAFSADAGQPMTKRQAVSGPLLAGLREYCEITRHSAARVLSTLFAFIVDTHFEGANDFIVDDVRDERPKEFGDTLGCFSQTLPCVFERGWFEPDVEICAVMERLRRHRREIGSSREISASLRREFLGEESLKFVYTFYGSSQANLLQRNVPVFVHDAFAEDEVHLVVRELDEEIELSLHYDSGRVDAARMLERLSSLIQQVVDGSDRFGELHTTLDREPKLAGGAIAHVDASTGDW